MLFILFPMALILSYAFIGGGIKLLDHLTDEITQSRQRLLLHWLLAISLIIIINIWVIFDFYTAVLALALVFGLLGARKIDNIYFTIIAVICLYVALYQIIGLFLFLLLSLFTLIPAVILDEVIHSLAQKINQPSLRWMLTHRPLVKIVVLILPFFGLLTFTHTIGFWCFDIAYDLVGYYFRAPSTMNYENSLG
ncbi:MAG: hypothetical protein ACFFAL_11815 [Promethearchaeota archaeon]